MSRTLLLRHADVVVTMDDARREIHDGAVLVDGNRIAAVGRTADLPPDADEVIDLTGHAPGALFALRARALGQPWIIGGYRGSAAFAQAALNTEPCEDLARAWILVEERGPRSLPVEMLSRYGIDARHDALSVGSAWSPTGEYQRRYVQRLLKPLRDPAAAAATCLKNRLGR